MIELTREQIEAIVRDELDFLIQYEADLSEPNYKLLECLFTVRREFEPMDSKAAAKLLMQEIDRVNA